MALRGFLSKIVDLVAFCDHFARKGGFVATHVTDFALKFARNRGGLDAVAGFVLADEVGVLRGYAFAFERDGGDGGIGGLDWKAGDVDAVGVLRDGDGLA